MVCGERFLVMPLKMKEIILTWMTETLRVEKAGQKLINFFNDHRYDRKKEVMVSLCRGF